VSAERKLARRFGDARKSDIGLEPLPVMVDQADQRDWRATDFRRRSHDGIELGLRLAIKYF